MMNPETERITLTKMIEWCNDLKNCAATGNKEKILKLLNRFPTDTTDYTGNTLLEHYVLESDDANDEIVKYLIEAGFNINFRSNKGQMVLFKSVIKNKVKIIKIFKDLGAFKDDTCYTDRIDSLLSCASEKVHIELLKLLVEAGCNVNARDKKDQTPLDYVIDDNCSDETSVELAKILIDAGASRDHMYYKNGTGPLHKACLYQNLKMIKLLIDSGFQASAADKKGDRPLHLVMREGKSDAAADDDNVTNIVKLLIQAGAKVNAKKYDGTTTLHLAVLFSYKNVFDLLREAGAKLDVVDNDGNTPLHMLGRSIGKDNNVYLAKQLVEAGADINKVNFQGQSCIFNVIASASVDLFMYCIRHGAKLDLIDYFDMDLLSYALVNWGCNDYDTVSNWNSGNKNYLLDHDADVEKKFGKNEIESQIKCLEILCKRGIDVNRVMKSGNSPFYLALKSYCHTKLIRALLHQGAIVNFNNLIVRKIMCKSHYNSKLQRMIIQHAAMCNSYKSGKGLVHFSFKKMNRQQVQDYEDCMEELKKLGVFRVYESMTLLNLIEGPVTSNYILNDHLIQSFETGLIAKSFPMFNEVLRERFEDEHEKYELISRASSSLQDLMEFKEHSYDLVYHNILSYLGTKDRRNLASLTNMEID